MTLKQLFCKHIYKEIGEEELGTTREADGACGWIQTYSNFKNIAITFQCVKCKRKIIRKKQIMLI